MSDLIVSVPDHCLSFFPLSTFVSINTTIDCLQWQTFQLQQLQLALEL